LKIETERLLLRPPAIEDFDDLHALTASPEMREHLSGFSHVEDDYKRLLSTIGGWATFGFGAFSVIERETGEYVGNCGIFRMLRGLGDGFDCHPEAGWYAGNSPRGRGVGREAMTGTTPLFAAMPAMRRTGCMISPGNKSSEAIAAKRGYRPTRMAEHRGDPVQLYARG